MADNALPCEALRCPFVFGSGYDDFCKELANRQQVHAPVGSFLGGFSKSASPNRTVELSGRFISIHATHVGSDNYTAVSRLAAPRLYGDARTSACLMGRDLLFPNRSSRGSTRPHNFLAFRDTAHTGSCDAIPTIEDFAMLRVLTATMLPTAHHEEVVF